MMKLLNVLLAFLNIGIGYCSNLNSNRTSNMRTNRTSNVYMNKTSNVYMNRTSNVNKTRTRSHNKNHDLSQMRWLINRPSSFKKGSNNNGSLLDRRNDELTMSKFIDRLFYNLNGTAIGI